MTKSEAKTGKKKQSAKLPAQVDLAVAAAEASRPSISWYWTCERPRGFTDFFVIASGTNSRQVRAIADAVMESLAKKARSPRKIEGADRSDWILLDYLRFHRRIVFGPERRVFYDLERLWGNADRIEMTLAKC
mgnify:CR=1 FL=1